MKCVCGSDMDIRVISDTGSGDHIAVAECQRCPREITARGGTTHDAVDALNSANRQAKVAIIEAEHGVPT